MKTNFSNKVLMGCNSSRAFELLLTPTEERILNYEDENQVQEIIAELALEQFLLVEHKSKAKQLHFKKYLSDPKTLIICED